MRPNLPFPSVTQKLQLAPSITFLGEILTLNSSMGGVTDAANALGFSLGGSQLSFVGVILYRSTIIPIRAMISPVAKCLPGQMLGEAPKDINPVALLCSFAWSLAMNREGLNSSAFSPHVDLSRLIIFEGIWSTEPALSRYWPFNKMSLDTTRVGAPFDLRRRTSWKVETRSGHWSLIAARSITCGGLAPLVEMPTCNAPVSISSRSLASSSGRE